MDTKSFLILTLFFFLASCASQSNLKGPAVIKHNTSVKSAMDTVVKVFQKHKLSVLDKDVAKGTIRFTDNVMIPAIPDKNGNYRQEVMSMGLREGLVFWETIYNVTVKGNRIKITKTVATPDSPTRIVKQVESHILHDIAERIGDEK